MRVITILIIETLQYIFGTGVSELDDLVLNTMGAGLGAWYGCIRHYQCRLGRNGKLPTTSSLTNQNGVRINTNPNDLK